MRIDVHQIISKSDQLSDSLLFLKNLKVDDDQINAFAFDLHEVSLPKLDDLKLQVEELIKLKEETLEAFGEKEMKVQELFGIISEVAQSCVSSYTKQFGGPKIKKILSQPQKNNFSAKKSKKVIF